MSCFSVVQHPSTYYHPYAAANGGNVFSSLTRCLWKLITRIPWISYGQLCGQNSHSSTFMPASKYIVYHIDYNVRIVLSYRRLISSIQCCLPDRILQPFALYHQNVAPLVPLRLLRVHPDTVPGVCSAHLQVNDVCNNGKP